MSGVEFTPFGLFGPAYTFHNCRFTSWANFSHAKFGDDTWFVLTEFTKGATFDHASFACRATFDDSIFHRNAEARKSADFRYATWGPETSFRRVGFGEGVDFYSTTFGSDSTFLGARLPKETDFLETRFPPDCGLGGIVVAAQHGGVGPLPSARRGLRVRFSWETVRTVGELHVLTRVSYAALLLVPLIAALWPSNLPLVTVRAPNLPTAWVLVFFSALFVLLAHTIYQVCASEMVKSKSLSEHVNNRAEEHRQADQNEQRDLLQRALAWLAVASNALPEIRHPNFVRRHGAAIWVPRHFAEFEKYRYAVGKEDPDEGDKELTFDRRLLPHTLDGLRLVVIDEGARAEYDVVARERLWAAHLSASLYVAGLYCISWVLSGQVAAVLSASGWQGPWLPDWWSSGAWVLTVLYGIVGLCWLAAAERSRRWATNGN